MNVSRLCFWRRRANNWQRGYGIWGRRQPRHIVTRAFNEEYEATSHGSKMAASTYYWGVLLIENCQAYQNQSSLVSEVRTITYRK